MTRSAAAAAWRRRWLRIVPPVLALGGGGARGFAHLGVLEVLEEQGIRPRAVAGTSMGAVIGAMVLASASATQAIARWREGMVLRVIPQVKPLRRLSEPHEHPILQVARRIRNRVVVSMAMNRTTILNGRPLARAIEFLLPDVDVSALPLPFVAVSTDLETGEEVRLRSGRLRQVLASSSAIPGLLPAVPFDGRLLVDGGVVAEVPVAAARALGWPVVAVDTSMDLPLSDHGELVLDTMMRTQMMTARLLRNHQVRRATHVVRPAVGHATWADWGRFDELVEAGRQAAREWLGLPPPSREEEERQGAKMREDAEKE